jgi:hypothetical protein
LTHDSEADETDVGKFFAHDAKMSGENSGKKALGPSGLSLRYKPRNTSSLVTCLCVLTNRMMELSVPMRKT